MNVTKSQIDGLRQYAEREEDGSCICLVGCWRGVRRSTHVALLRKGLLEVCDLRPPVSVRRTFSYNFGNSRVYKFSHFECDSRFRLTNAGRAVLAAADADAIRITSNG